VCAVGGATQHPLVPLPRVPGPPTEKMSGLAGKKGRPSPRTGRRGKRNNQVLYREHLAAEEAKQKKAEESRKAARSRGAERRQAAFTEVQLGLRIDSNRFDLGLNRFESEPRDSISPRIGIKSIQIGTCRPFFLLVFQWHMHRTER